MGKGKGYQQAPWKFTGRALYQLHLVKTAEAKNFIPGSLKLVECFGYTLGGLYLARYDDSPVGNFDEMVVLAGLVWNPPTSCAWASRVYVNNIVARNHGIKSVGLPSAMANFCESPHDSSVKQQKKRKKCWWAGPEKTGSDNTPSGEIVVSVSEGRKESEVCRLSIPQSTMAGPPFTMKLPSFSGKTALCPRLLHYAVEMKSRIRLSAPIRIMASKESKGVEGMDRDQAMHRLLAKGPLLTIAFDDLNMYVDAPQEVPESHKKNLTRGRTLAPT